MNEQGEYTGGSVSYYRAKVKRPTSGGEPYEAECNDIIEALRMNYAEGNAFKALWRRAAARVGKSKRGYTTGLYDAEKVVFFGERLVEQEKAAAADAVVIPEPPRDPAMDAYNKRLEGYRAQHGVKE